MSEWQLFAQLPHDSRCRATERMYIKPLLHGQILSNSIMSNLVLKDNMSP